MKIDDASEQNESSISDRDTGLLGLESEAEPALHSPRMTTTEADENAAPIGDGEASEEQSVATSDEDALTDAKTATDRLFKAAADAKELGVDPLLFVDLWHRSAERRNASRASEGARELELRRMEAASEAQERTISAQSEALDHQLTAQRDATIQAARLANRETNVRFLLALILVAGTVLIVGLGVALGTRPEEVAQYVAPIAGLAGIAVGYFFGRADR